MTRSLIPPSRTPQCATALIASACLAAMIAGCGSTGNTSSARLRSVDASTDSGTTDLLVNGSASYGDQSYFNVSSYFYISTGDSNFTGLSNTQSTSVTARTNTYPLSTGDFYTAYYVGRADVTGITDNRFVEILLTNDSKPTLSSGQAAVRVIDAAPDAGAVDVLVNGSAPASSFTDQTFTVARDAQLVGTYVPITAGTLSIQVNKTGTSTPVISPVNVSVSAGQGLTLLVTEPTGGTAPLGTVGGTNPTYALQTTTE